MSMVLQPWLVSNQKIRDQSHQMARAELINYLLLINSSYFSLKWYIFALHISTVFVFIAG